MKTAITSANVPTPAGAFSPGPSIGGWIFLSGQGGFDPETGALVSDDIADQAEQAFRNIEVLLEAAGARLDDVVSCLVHITDLAEFARFNAVYENWFPDPQPVRTTVRADLVAEMRVEVTVIANAA